MLVDVEGDFGDLLFDQGRGYDLMIGLVQVLPFGIQTRLPLLLVEFVVELTELCHFLPYVLHFVYLQADVVGNLATQIISHCDESFIEFFAL